MSDKNGITKLVIRATVPTQDYGNLEYEAHYDSELTPLDDAQAETKLAELRLVIGKAVLPMVENQIQAACNHSRALRASDNPEIWLLNNQRIFFWLRTTCPELEIPAFNRLMQSRGNTPAPTSEPIQDTPAPTKLSPEEMAQQFAAMGIQTTPPPAPAQVDTPAKPKGTSRLNQPKKNRIGGKAHANS